MARSDRKIALTITVYQKLVKQVEQAESTDDIPIETDMRLFMADFTPTRPIPDHPAKISKVYAIGLVNETEINEKTVRHIANQRLEMDYARLKDAGIVFEAPHF